LSRDGSRFSMLRGGRRSAAEIIKKPDDNAIRT